MRWAATLCVLLGLLLLGVRPVAAVVADGICHADPGGAGDTAPDVAHSDCCVVCAIPAIDAPGFGVHVPAPGGAGLGMAGNARAPDGVPRLFAAGYGARAPPFLS